MLYRAGLFTHTSTLNVELSKTVESLYIYFSTFHHPFIRVVCVTENSMGLASSPQYVYKQWSSANTFSLLANTLIQPRSNDEHRL